MFFRKSKFLIKEILTFFENCDILFIENEKEVRNMKNILSYQLNNTHYWDTISMPITFSCLKSCEPAFVGITTRGHKGKPPF